MSTSSRLEKKLFEQIISPISFQKFLGRRVSSTTYLEPPRLNEICNLIHSLKINKTPGPDNIDAYFIRAGSNVIAPYLTQLCFLSFEFGIFPGNLQHAKIVSIFKLGTKTEVNTCNYRPISLLSNFSKIFEKLIVFRLTTFLT